MARLPTPGGDDGNWGTILNDFLDQAHNSDGSLKGSSVSGAGAEMSANKGQASGYAPLDSSAKLPSSNLPVINLSSLGDVNVSGVTDTQVLSYSSSAGKWEPATVGGGGTVPDADATTKGILKLTGDLGGTAASPTVPGLASKLTATNNLSDLASASTARTNLGLGSAATLASSAVLQAANNLSDLGNAGTARINLGLGGAATLNVGTTAGTVAAGDDSRITGAVQKSTATAKGDLLAATASATISRLGVGSNGQVLSADSTAGTGLKWVDASTVGSTTLSGLSDVSIITPANNNVLTYNSTDSKWENVAGVTSVAGRTGVVTLANTDISGLGGAATLNVGTSTGTVAAGDDSRITGAAQKSSNLSDLASASTARTNLGLGGAATLNVGTSTGTVAAGDDSRITGAVQKSTYSAKGSILAASAASTPANLTVGADGTILTADSTQTTGVKWNTISASGLGALVAANNLSDLANASTARSNLGLGTAATLNVDTDGTLAGNSDTAIATQKATKTYADTKVPSTRTVNGKALSSNISLASTDLSDTTALEYKLVPTAVKTANYTAAALDFVPVDATSASVTVTLPTAPADGTIIGVKMVITASSHTTAVAAGGTDVFNKASGSTSLTLTYANQAVVVQYKSSSAIWYVISDDIGLTALDSRYLQSSNNLSELASASTARTNLGLGTAATQNTSAFLQPSNNLSDVSSASTARTNLGLGSAATLASSAVLQSANNLSDLNSASTARTNLGLGTSSAVQFSTLGLGTAVTAQFPALYTVYAATQSSDNNAYATVGIADQRTFSITQSSAGSGDGPAGLRVAPSITLNSGVTSDYIGVALGGSVNGSGTVRTMVGYSTHFDIVGPSGAGATVAAFQTHIGLIGSNADTGVGFDISAINAISGTWTSAIGFRMDDNAGLTATNKWGFQIGNYQSQHRGKLSIGGASVSTTPNSRLDVRESTSNTDVFRLATAPASGTDDILIRTVQTQLNTTNATSTQIIGITLSSNKTHMIDLAIVWRRTGGTSGSTNDGGAMRHVIVLKYDGTTATQIGSTAAIYNQASQVTAAPTIGSLAYGIQGINVAGFANNNVTWHCTATIQVVGS